jgi:hypothetical protein
MRATAAPQEALRRRVLESCGATLDQMDALLAYGAQPCRWAHGTPLPAFPLPDDAQVVAWLGYEREAAEAGVVEALKRHLVQLNFPVRAGMSAEAAYQQATRRGVFSAAEPFRPGLTLRHPERVQLKVCQTIAGRLPVLIAGDRADFEALVQALTGRNEPAPVPAAMGACLVKGLNNWSRVAAYRAAWQREHAGAGDAAWAEEFQRLIPQKEQYQDRLIILSSGPYSATPAADVGLPEPEWLERSVAIRQEHELTHFFVHRVFGVMRTHVFDEIVADFVGLARVFGTYRADLALRFLGLEAYPQYRPGGRLEVYRPEPPLGDAADAILRTLVWRAVQALQSYATRWQGSWSDLAAVAALTFAISQLTLEELAAPELPDLIEARLP